MKAILVDGSGTWQLIDAPMPEPGPGELLLKVAASGICGTDLRIVAGDYGHAKFPVIIGHEFSGHVVAVGEGVDGFTIGDLVAADPNIHCGKCRWCLIGAYNLCEDAAAVGVNLPGAMAEYVAIQAVTAVRLQEGTDPRVGALIEPLSCVLHAFNQMGEMIPGPMLVIGGGGIGLLALIEGRARGYDVRVVEPLQERRELALRLGASAVGASAAEVSEDQQYSLVVDASGVPAAIADGLTRLEHRGTFVQMGVAPSAARLEFSPYALCVNEWRFIGSYSVADAYEAAARRAPDLSSEMLSLVNQTYALEDFGSALDAMTDPTTIKVQITP